MRYVHIYSKEYAGGKRISISAPRRPEMHRWYILYAQRWQKARLSLLESRSPFTKPVISKNEKNKIKMHEQRGLRKDSKDSRAQVFV